jgi:hypothetical protein
MQTVSISPDDKYAVSYTNNNQLIICTIATGEYRILQCVVDEQDGDIVGVMACNRHCVIWTNVGAWKCIALNATTAVDKTMVSRGNLDPVDKLSIVYMTVYNNERYVSSYLLQS